MDIEFRPIIYTYDKPSYLNFIKEVFGAEVEFLKDDTAFFMMGNTKFLVLEIPKKRSKLISSFEVKLHSFKELESLSNRLEFYYYRQNLKHQAHLKQLSDNTYQLKAVDPDQREISINFGQDHSLFKATILNNSYN